MPQSSSFPPGARAATAALLAATLLSSATLGCYAYVPTAGAALPAGSKVRLQLTDAGSASLAPYLGPGTVSVTGTLVAADDSAVGVAVGATQLPNGAERYWNGESVAVPRRYVATVQRQQFSRGRTALLSAALGGVGYLVYAGLGGVGGGNGSTTRGGGGGPK